MTDAVETYHESVNRVDSTNRRLLQIVGIAAAMIVITVLAGMGFISYKINDGNSTIHAVRTSQVENTNTANARSNCQNRAFDALLDDINRAIAHPGQHLQSAEIPRC